MGLGIAIAIAFLIIVSLILWCLIGSKGNWIFKFFLITISILFSIGLHNSIQDMTGWASHKEMPEKFLVHWTIVKEPNKVTKDTGSIYFWISEIDENNKVKVSQNISFVAPHTPEPRTHQLPYTEKLHKQVAEMTKMLKQGKQVIGKNRGEGDEGKDGEDGAGKKGKLNQGKKTGLKGGAFSFSQEQEYHFYELPPAKIPEKILE